VGIETSTPSGGVAILGPDALVTEDHLLGTMMHWGGRAHSQRIVAGLQNLLEGLGISPQDVGAVAVSIGPGSFTGVRVGLAAAKAFAWALGIPLIGVPALEAFALRAFGFDDEGRAPAPDLAVCPVLDARRGEVYWAAFAPDCSAAPDCPSAPAAPSAAIAGIPEFARLTPDSMTRADRLAETLDAALPPPRPLLFCGEGALRLREDLRQRLGPRARFTPPHRAVAGPEEVAWLGLMRLRAGLIDDPLPLAPVYLRQPDMKKPGA